MLSPRPLFLSVLRFANPGNSLTLGAAECTGNGSSVTGGCSIYFAFSDILSVTARLQPRSTIREKKVYCPVRSPSVINLSTWEGSPTNDSLEIQNALVPRDERSHWNVPDRSLGKPSLAIIICSCHSTTSTLSRHTLGRGAVSKASAAVHDKGGVFSEYTCPAQHRLLHEPTTLGDCPAGSGQAVEARYESSEAVPHHLTVAWHDRRAARLLRQRVDCTAARPSTC